MNRSDMPKQVQAFRNGGGLMSLATIPVETTMAGQPHRLAYINPEEEQLLLAMGGAGEPGPGGIVSYFLHNQESRDKIKSAISKAFGGGGGNNNTQSQQSDDDEEPSNNVGLVDSLLMGFGLKEKTDAYYNATARSIARSQGSDAAQNYLDNNADNISNQSNITVNVTEEADKFYDDTPSGGGDEGGGAVATTTDVVTGGGDEVVTQTAIDSFVMNEDQQTAALGALQRINEDLFKITQGKSFDELDSGQKQAYIKNNSPTAKELSAITGLDLDMAKAILDAPGAGTDLRNWGQILQDDNPLAATQAATAAMYSVQNLGELQGVTMQPSEAILNPNQVISQSGNYVLYNPGTGGTATSKKLGMPGSLRLGIVNPLDDGRQMLLTSYQLGNVDDNFGQIAAQYGGGQGILDLIPDLNTYLTENITIPETTYTQVVKDVNAFGDVSYYDPRGYNGMRVILLTGS